MTRDSQLVVTESPAGEKQGSPLPLRATPFEFYYLADHRPDYPTLFPIWLWLRGTLDRDAFQLALQSALARHPMLSARIRWDNRGWPWWVAGEPPGITWNPDPDRDGEFDHFDLARKPGLKILARDSSDETVMSFVFHHACADGLAGLQLIGDILVAYHHFRAGKTDEPPWPALDPHRLRRRDEYGLADYKPRLMDAVNTLRAWAPLVLRRAAVVSAARKAPLVAPVDASLPFAQHWFSIAESKELANLARRLQGTVNDLLLRDLFCVLADWNQGSPDARRPIRILVPTNLRTKEDAAMPVANVLSFAFLTRSGPEIADRRRLWETIRDQTAAIRRWRLGLYFVGGLAIACKLPRFVRWFLNRRWPFATATLSNVGPVLGGLPLAADETGRLICGNVLVERIGGVPPLRRDTRVGMVVLTYAGRLGLCLRSDPAWFSRDDQQRLLDLFVERIRATLKEEEPSGGPRSPNPT
jgi:hypothetical protein